jgi:ferrochelatase
VLAVLGRLRQDGARMMVACSVGFLADHLEMFYDLDIQARGLADCPGMRLIRAGPLNDHPLPIETLADAVRTAAGRRQESVAALAGLSARIASIARHIPASSLHRRSGR